jgi:hypothetical protein
MSSPFVTWNITADGNVGPLLINDNPTGGIDGTIFGDPIVGLFNSIEGTLYFLRSKSSDETQFEVYTGRVFAPVATSNSGTKTSTTLLLAGNFEVYPTTGRHFPIRMVCATGTARWTGRAGHQLFPDQPDLPRARGRYDQYAANCDSDEQRYDSILDRFQIDPRHQRQQLFNERHLWRHLTTRPTMHDVCGFYTRHHRTADGPIGDYQHRP